MELDEEYEEWRYVLNYPEYVVSNLGNIKRTGSSREQGRGMTATVAPDGHILVHLQAGPQDYRHYRLDRIVATSFLLASPDVRSVSRDIAHLDGDKTNCRVDNLRWVD